MLIGQRLCQEPVICPDHPMVCFHLNHLPLMFVRKLAFFSLAMFAAGPVAQAQVRPQVTVHFIMGWPQGELNNHIADPAIGANAIGLISFRNYPFSLGLDLALVTYGYESREALLGPEIPEVIVDVETLNNIFLSHAVLRLQPPTGYARPYVDGLVGFKYFFTHTQVDDGHGDEAIASSLLFDDIALSYGMGAGLDIQLYHGSFGEHVGTLLLNLGVRYLFGSPASYLTEGSVERVDEDVLLDVEHSQTDMLFPNLGVSFTF